MLLNCPYPIHRQFFLHLFVICKVFLHLFIGISNLFIADIKDLYINLGLFFFIVLIYKEDFLNDDNNTTFKDDLKSIKRFLVFVKNDIFRKEKKEKA